MQPTESWFCKVGRVGRRTNLLATGIASRILAPLPRALWARCVRTGILLILVTTAFFLRGCSTDGDEGATYTDAQRVKETKARLSRTLSLNLPRARADDPLVPGCRKGLDLLRNGNWESPVVLWARVVIPPNKCCVEFVGFDAYSKVRGIFLERGNGERKTCRLRWPTEPPQSREDILLPRHFGLKVDGVQPYRAGFCAGVMSVSAEWLHDEPLRVGLVLDDGSMTEGVEAFIVR